MRNAISFLGFTAAFYGICAQNVGIGISSPQAKLHIQQTGSFTLPLLRVDTVGATVPHLVVMPSGQVGIGTATPAYNLHVAGSTYVQDSLRIDGALHAAGDPGQPGYVLTSQGPNNSPVWQPLSTTGGGGGGSGYGWGSTSSSYPGRCFTLTHSNFTATYWDAAMWNGKLYILNANRIVVTDPIGNIYWARSLSPISSGESAIAVDTVSGNILVVSGNQIIIMDSLGNLQSAQGYGINSWSNLLGYDIMQLSDGNFLITGDINVGLRDWGGFVMKVDPTGNVIWATALQGTGSDTIIDLRDAAELLDGNLVAIGTIQHTQSTWSTTRRDRNVLVIKLSPSGNLIWAKEVGINNWNFYQRGLSIKAVDNKMFLLGVSGSTANDSLYLIKMDTAGNLQWLRTVHLGTMYGGGDLSVLPDASVTIIRGFTRYSGFGSTVNNQIFVAQFGPNGQFRWAKIIGEAGDDFGHRIFWSSSTSDLIVVGATNSFGGGDAGYIVHIDPATGAVPCANVCSTPCRYADVLPIIGQSGTINSITLNVSHPTITTTTPAVTIENLPVSVNYHCQ